MELSALQIEGHDALILENDLLRAVIIPKQRGMILELIYKPKNFNMIDTFPLRPLGEDNHSGRWLERGAYETSILSSSEHTCSLRLLDSEVAVVRTYTLIDNKTVLRIDLARENFGTTDIDMLWTELPLLGPPLIDAHCTLDADAATYFDPAEEPMLRNRWPLLPDGTDLSRVQVHNPVPGKNFYLTDFSAGRCRVNSPTHGVAFELRWDETKFPYCWLNYDRHYIRFGPASGMRDAIKDGYGFITLPAGGRETTWFEAEVIEL